MEILIAERRRFKRYSAVPIKIYLKKQDQFEFTEMIDISIGGLQVRTSKTLEMYEEYECQLELPLVDGKDLIYAKAMVWRIDPDEERFHEKKEIYRFQVHRYSGIRSACNLRVSCQFQRGCPYS